MRRGTVVSPVTVGREEETQQLLLELEDARLGRGRLTVVVGEAGVGKSRVAADLVGVARGRGMVVLEGRAVETAAPVPYRLIASALLPAFRRGGPPDDAALGPYRSALSLLVPEWTEASRPVADNAGLAVLEASGRLLRVLAGSQGLLIVLEDAHWADAETLAVLDYLTDTLSGERILCLVTARPGGEAGDARRLLDRCATCASASVVTLDRLATTDVTGLVQAILGTPAVPVELDDFVQTTAEGLPLAAEELIAELIAERRLFRDDDAWHYEAGGDVPAPSGFQRLVERRVARLRPATRQALKAAALLGREFDWMLLSSIAGLSESEVLAALGEAVDAQLLSTSTDPGRMSFRHALIAACVARSLLPPERVRLARAAAAAVEAAAVANRAAARLELAADLWSQAGEPESAARLLVRLGTDALGRGAVASAEAILERALGAATADSEVHLAVPELLSDALSRSGNIERCLTVTAELPVALSRTGSSNERVHAGWLRLARAETDAGGGTPIGGARPDSGHFAAAARALDLADAADGSEAARAAAMAARARLAIETEDYERASALADDALSLAASTAGAEAQCEALYVKARAMRPTAPEQAVVPLEHALAIVERDGLEHWRLRILVELGLIDGPNSGRRDRLLAARDLARERGEMHTAAVAGLNLGFPSAPEQYEEWTIDDATSALEDAIELSRRHHLPTLGMALRFRAMAAALTGSDAAFDRDITELRRMHEGREWMLADVLFWRGLFTEDRALATAQLPAIAHVVPIRDAASAPFRGFYALFCAVIGRGPESAIDSVIDSGYGSTINRGAVGLAESVVLGARGDHDEAARRHAASLPLVPVSQLSHMAQRLVAEAAIRDGWGAPAEWLRPAYEYFESSGTPAPARACGSMLRSIGEPVARRGRGDAVVPQDLRARGVTSREMDVLLLIREGLSNNEIAERLFMSRRTVETHVSHLLAKLEVTSRGRLVAQH